MTLNDKIMIVKTMIDDTPSDEQLTIYLGLAASKILNRLYPFEHEETEVPKKYEMLQCEISAYLWNKRGAEGETSHDENGIRRVYGSADVPSSLMRQITPYVKVIK